MKTIHISFTPEQMATLNAALIELPFKVSAPLIQDINVQIQHQVEKTKSDDLISQTTQLNQSAGD